MWFSRIFIIITLATAAGAGQLRQLAVLDIPGRPGFDRAAFANGMLLLAHAGSDTLDVFDPAKRRVMVQVKGMSGPHGLAVDAAGQKVYVANSTGKNIAVVSTREWSVDQTIPLAAPPYDLVLAPERQQLIVANWDQRSLSAVDLTDEKKVTTLDLNGSPAGLALDASRSVVFASLQDTAEVVVVALPAMRVVTRYKLAGSQPTGIVVDPAAHRLYVAVRGALLTLDAETGQQLGRVTAPVGADALWLDSSAGNLYLASAGGLVSAYHAAGSNLTLIQEIHSEVRGHSVAFDPARKLIFLPGGREGRSKLLILKQLGPTGEEQVATK